MQTVKNITVPQHQTVGLTINLFLGSERNFCLPEDFFHALLLGTVLIASCERSFGRGLFSFSKHLPAGISFFFWWSFFLFRDTMSSSISFMMVNLKKFLCFLINNSHLYYLLWPWNNILFFPFVSFYGGFRSLLNRKMDSNFSKEEVFFFSAN